MSINRKLFTVGAISILGAAAFGKVGLDTIRKPKARFTAEHWVGLLGGSKQAASQSNGAAKATNSVGAPTEIIGRAGYPLYRS